MGSEETNKSQSGKRVIRDNEFKNFPWSNKDFGDWEPAYGFELMPWAELMSLPVQQHAEVAQHELFRLVQRLLALERERIFLREAFLGRHSNFLKENALDTLGRFLAG